MRRCSTKSPHAILQCDTEQPLKLDWHALVFIKLRQLISCLCCETGVAGKEVMPMVSSIARHWHLHLGPNMTQSGIRQPQPQVEFMIDNCHLFFPNNSMCMLKWLLVSGTNLASININCGFCLAENTMVSTPSFGWSWSLLNLSVCQLVLRWLLPNSCVFLATTDHSTATGQGHITAIILLVCISCEF